MFTELVLENYKSFNRISFDMKDTANRAKNLIAIYGENGSGKSSLIEAFGILRLSLQTLQYTNKMNELNALMDQENKKLFMEQYSFFDIVKYNNFASLDRVIKNTKTIGSDTNLCLEYSFLLNNANKGKYTLEFDHSNKLISEQLNYTINDRIGNIYTIEKSENDEIVVHLNKKIFLSSDVRKELTIRTQKLWGKHSFLAIFNSMIDDFNDVYIKDNVSFRLVEVLNFFSAISVETESYSAVSRASCLLPEFDSGKIELSEENKIEKTEKLLYKYFSSLYVDIKGVFYKKRIEENTIEYELYLRKNIYGKILDIPFSLESKGTKKLLEIFPFFLNVVEGGISFIDEIDNGIHDILMNHLLDNLAEDITGQLVFSTHDTIMLKELPKKNVSFITIDYDGNKKIKYLKDYEDKTISQNNSLQNQYLKGAFEGIPIPIDIDFEEMTQLIQEDDHE